MIPKFRAWLKEAKRMVWVIGINFDCDSLYVEDIAIYDQGNSYDSCPEEPFLPYEVILMQSTGLTDINGKEIYEGDIVEITYAKQVWDAIPVYCVNRKAKYNYLIDSLEDFFYTRKRGYIADSELKVLGNIYENPELKKELIDD